MKIVSALAERVGQGDVGGCTALADSAWRRLQLPVEKPWSMRALTTSIERSLMSRCAQGHEPTGNVSVKV